MLIMIILVIAFGTGGIKPCVSAFGANQFGPTQKHHLDSFFSVFYASINVGSLIGNIIEIFFLFKLIIN